MWLVGQPISEAITMAAEMDHKNAVAQNQRQQALQMQHNRSQDQLRAQILPQILQNLNPNDLQGNIAKLQQAGLPLKDSLAIASKVSEYAVKSNQPSPFEQKVALENEKSQNRLEEKKVARQEKFLAENDMKAKKVNEQLSAIGNLENESDKFHQGFGSGIAYGLNKVNPFGGGKEAAAYETFNSEAKKLILDIAASQKGVQSDLDIKNITATAPNTENTKEGNKQIIDKMRKFAERELEYTQKANEWVEEGGDIREFEKAWQKYVNENPLFPKGERKEKKEVKKEESSGIESLSDAELEKLAAG